jgi:signal transduction histidine kinase
VAHEINNPLGVIQCYAGLIRKSTEPGSQILEDVKIIEKHTLNCKSVVEALLSFARVSEPRMEQADIHACIEDVLSVLDRHMQKHSITITRQYGSGLPLLTIDVQKMKQVFMNLLLNAQQSIGHQGNIDIETQCDMSTHVVYVRISDSGTGISVRNQERIFEPFFTTKSESNGTGLGLAVTYGIVKQHDGDITVDSSPGEGATFTVALPVVEHMQ